MIIPTSLVDSLKKAHTEEKQFTFLVGAGLSAESGVPTFRGKEGYWVVGSENYHPQEMATKAMFDKKFMEVWKWYLYRISEAEKVSPNPGHYALVHFENLLKKFALISQNVDGLNLRAGSSVKRFYPIHGDLNFMRCSLECTSNLYYLPIELKARKTKEDLTEQELVLLKCPSCGALTRPHILWFDEYYNEAFYKFNSVQQIALQTDVLISIGTTGTTNLPNQVFATALHNGAIIVDINIEENPFSEALKNYKNGFSLVGKSGELLPLLYQEISVSL